MKKLFENTGGNKFKLLTESSEGKYSLVESGLKKVFTNADGSISYNRVESVGLGYIKDVSEAQRVALDTARNLCESFGFKDDEENAKFVKQENHDESDMSNPEEKQEVQIAETILDLLSVIYTNNPQLIHDTDENDIQINLKKIEAEARKLLKLHKDTKKPYSGSPMFTGGGHGGL